MFLYLHLPIAKRVEYRVAEKGKIILLPLPRFVGDVSVEEAIVLRRSIREYLDRSLTLEQLGQILYAAQGITEPRREFRAAPSAGATYPLEVFVVVGEGGVVGLRAGVYHYLPKIHALELIKVGDFREPLCRACLGQPWVRDAPVVIVIGAIYERTTARYGERGVRYVHIEVGHVGENIYLQCAALGLATVAVGAFYDEKVKKVLDLPPNVHPLYVMPIGYPVKPYTLRSEEIVEYIIKNREELGYK